MPPLAANQFLSEWLAQERPALHIDARPTVCYSSVYFSTGVVHPRLKVACADYGYTQVELAAFKAQGKTARDLAQEIVARGVYEGD